ncbi:MAG: hypothetical protein HY079_14320 [Elusimicrobia bacterium]|nr:hypothetical protein [Elusimicrobiota bacterium]
MSAPETRSAAPAFLSFVGTAAAYWLALVVALWLPLWFLGNGLGPLRVIGGLIMPGVLLLMGWRQRGRSPALHALFIALAFAGSLASSVARHALLPAPLLADAAARALIRMMTYAYAGAALHAAILNAVAAYRAEPPSRPS